MIEPKPNLQATRLVDVCPAGKDVRIAELEEELADANDLAVKLKCC